MGMTREEKYEARKPWQLSLIIKHVGRSIGYQYLLRKLQVMWKIQHHFLFMCQSNDCFIARFTNMQDYETAPLNGPWVINYLHVQHWVSKFMAKMATSTPCLYGYASLYSWLNIILSVGWKERAIGLENH